MILLLVLIALTGCQTIARTDSTFTRILISQVPDLPSFPIWPSVTWEYEDNRYSLSENDVDKILDYLENKIPLYEFEIEQYEEQLQIILNSLCLTDLE